MKSDGEQQELITQLETRLGRLLATLGIGYGQDEEQAVAALMNRLTELGEHPTQLARDAVRHAPKWR